MIITTPYYSQRVDVSDPNWQWRACGVACVAMVIARQDQEHKITLDALINEGRELGAYREGVGWVHGGLVTLAGQHGVRLIREEYKGVDAQGNDLMEVGIKNILAALEEGCLVLVSAARKFDDATKPHLVLLTGFEVEEGVVKGLYYHDPDAYTEKEGSNQFVPIEQFKRFWRKLALFEATHQVAFEAKIWYNRKK